MEIIPFEMHIGEDFYLPILYEFEVCGVDYSLDLSGYAVEMQVGNGIFTPSGNIIVDVSTANGNIILDGPEGKINIYIPNSISSTLIPGVYDYGVKVTNAVGLVERLIGAQNQFKIKAW